MTKEKLEQASKKLYATENSSADLTGAVKLIIEYLQAELDLVKLDRDAGIEINAELKAKNSKLKEALKNFLDDKFLKEVIKTNTKLENVIEFMKNDRVNLEKDYVEERRKVREQETINYGLKAENENLKSSMEWQPIETAPKDGTDILVFNKFSKEQLVVFWDNGAWVFATNRDKCQIITNAHYWMPLPKSPQIKE